MGKGAELGVHCHNGDIPHLIPAVPSLQLSNQNYRSSFEEFLGVFEIVFLVLFNGGEAVTASIMD